MATLPSTEPSSMMRPGSGSTGGNMRGTLVGEPGSPMRPRSRPGMSSAVRTVIFAFLAASLPLRLGMRAG